ncbi:hypothetical protein D0864_14793 [Hortaea werneckii]|uniref:Metallo-beta-lactamase domain-containing protein n=1 Tax=Hortaea werneckii TaxID=91943 RepID=A0A3M7CAC8_HORWE|nr:hypothetical protein D0864_14793 [Hortaea werneckii]
MQPLRRLQNTAQQHSSSIFSSPRTYRVLYRRDFHTSRPQASQLHQPRKPHPLDREQNLPPTRASSPPEHSTLRRTAHHIPCSTHSEIMSATATIDSAYDPKTGTWQYIVADPETLDAVIIDPVLDYDPSTQTISTETADRLLSLINSKHYRIVRVLETHAHADHLTAASYLQNALARQQGFRPPVCIGKRIRTVQQAFGQRYGVPAQELEEAFDLLFEDGDVFYIGNLKVEVTHLPGHTPDHIGYMIADNVFCGDSVFIADLGTARCDFPGGDAKALYESTRKLLSLPDHYRIWTGHDYPTAERQTPVPFMSVGDQKKQNRYLGDAVTATDFEKMRRERDAVLNEPKLLHPSLQINIRGGKMPGAASDGQRYMHLPLKFPSQM